MKITETAQILPRGPSLLSSSVSGCLLGKPQGGQTDFSLSGYLGVKNHIWCYDM